MNKDDNSDNETDYYNEDFEEKPKALKKRRKLIKRKMVLMYQR